MLLCQGENRSKRVGVSTFFLTAKTGFIFIAFFPYITRELVLNASCSSYDMPRIERLLLMTIFFSVCLRNGVSGFHLGHRVDRMREDDMPRKSAYTGRSYKMMKNVK